MPSTAGSTLLMIQVPNAELVGADGPVRFLDLFRGNDELVVYRHMWHHGQPIEGQCPGCTLSIWDFRNVVYLAERGVSFAVISKGVWEELAPYVELMGSEHSWYSTAGVEDTAIAGERGGDIACFLRQGDRAFLTYETTARGVETIMASLHLLDLTPYGRMETWDDSPEGWPRGSPAGWVWQRDGRPTAQWTRPGAAPVERGHKHHH